MTPAVIATAQSPQFLHTTVHFKSAGKRQRLVLIPVNVNGAGPFYFFLDTGAPTTVVSARFAKSHGIEPLSAASGLGATGAVAAHLTTLQRIDVGGAHRESVPSAIIENFEEIHRSVPDVVGALGLDFLKNYVVTIDYATKTVTLEDGRDATHDGLPLEIGDCVYANVTINGQGPYVFVIDTGASNNVFDPQIAAELSLPLLATKEIRGAGGAGVGTASTSEFSSLAAGPYEQRDGTADVADIFAPLRAELKRNIVGILGYPFFGGRTVTFDFPHGRLILK